MSFTVTLFMNKRLQEYSLKRGYNAELYSDLAKLSGANSTRYSKLLYEEENRLFIQDNVSEQIKVKFEGKPLHNKQIENGDYFIVEDETHNLSFQMHFMDLTSVFLSMKKYKVNKNQTISLGRAQENVIVLSSNLAVSRQHAEISFDNGKAYIQDLESKTGVFLNGECVSRAELKYGDIIQIVGLKVVYLDDFLAVNEYCTECRLDPFHELKYANIQKNEDNHKYFTSAPRILKKLAIGDHEIDLPPSPVERKQMPLLYTIGPSLTMAIAMMISIAITINNTGNKQSSLGSIVMAVSMLIGALVWPIALRKYQQREERKEEHHRIERYTSYIREQREELEQIRMRNALILTENMFPSPSEIMNFSRNDQKRHRLWEKTVSNKDFLEVRLGQGDRDFEVKVKTGKRGFILHEDLLAEESQKVIEDFQKTKDVPITISLKTHRLVGLMGQKQHVRETANNMALGIAGQHSYDEVKLVFIHSKEDSKYFNWVREIPHVWNAERSMRFVATTKEEVHKLFLMLNELMTERENINRENITNKVQMTPKFIFFLADQSLIENEPLIRFLYNPNNEVDITTVILGESMTDLPKECTVLIQNNPQYSQMYINTNDGTNSLIEFEADQVSLDELNRFSVDLAKLKIKTDAIQLDIPERVPFLGMYKSGNIEDLEIEKLWKSNLSYKSLQVPIGFKAGGELFSLDIHENYHGPHGLVAGMTGSGKSEFLQSYIISAAMNYHPHDLAFVLIDYKGGGMANIFDGMPHIAGKITNLSGNQLQRSLNSIDAEIKKRQRLFNQYDINHIDKYQQLFKENVATQPLPHLVIIADEFAQLKSQQPDFMRKLIDVAQIGRSLGVHLILATQKPAGLVDDQIWGNSRFRVCLKVLDKHDSNEMIRKPDAALIKLPGRCYVQVGYDEIYEQVQSGYSGLEYDPLPEFIDENELTLSLVDATATPVRRAMQNIKSEFGIVESKEKEKVSQLKAIINQIIDIQDKNAIEPFTLWIEPLKETLFLEELQGFVPFDGTWKQHDDLKVVIGLADITEIQTQEPVTIDFLKDGHVSIQGASATGKTTLLQTILFALASKYSPEQLEMYIFDFASRNSNYFKEFPHCQSVIYAEEDEAISDAFQHLLDIIDERKEIFSKYNIGSFEAFKRTRENQLPAIVVAIDSYALLREKYDEQAMVSELVTNGRTYGIYFIITGNNSNSIYYKISDNISNAISLRLNDPMDYRDVFKKPVSVFPEEEVRGRGLVSLNKTVLEFQSALVADVLGESERIEYIREISRRMMQAAESQGMIGKKKGFEKKPSLHKQKSSDSVKAASPVKRQATRPANTLQMIDADAEDTIYVGNLQKLDKEQYIYQQDFSKFAIIGPENAGKTEYLKFLIANILENTNNELFLLDRPSGELKQFASSQPEIKYCVGENGIQQFVMKLQELVDERKAILQFDLSGTASERFSNVYVCINGFKDLYDTITDEDLVDLEKLAEEALEMKISFISLENVQALIEYSSTALYLYLIKRSNGIMMAGKFEDQTIFNAEKMTASDRSAQLQPGQGYLVIGETFGIVRNPQHAGKENVIG